MKGFAAFTPTRILFGAGSLSQLSGKDIPARKVLLVAGRNKLAPTREEAERRIRDIAAPRNVARHPGFRTPCAVTGICADCNSPDRICNTRMEMLRCHPRGRIKVILIDREMGL